MYQAAIEEQPYRAPRSTPPQGDIRLSRIKDLRVAYMFTGALRRLEEEVPADDYTMWLEGECRIVRCATGEGTWNESALILKDAAKDLASLFEAIK
jgi:hypothetical protein